MGFRDVVNPRGDTEVERVTVPEKPLTLSRFIPVVFEDPVRSVRLGVPLYRLKSGPTISVWFTILVASDLSVTVSCTL